MWNLHRLFHYLAGNEKCWDKYKAHLCERNKGHWGNHHDTVHDVRWYMRRHPILGSIKFGSDGGHEAVKENE